MMLEALAPWLSGLVALAALVISILGNRSKALHDKLGRHAARIDDLENRATKCEAALEHLPSKDNTHRLEVSMHEMRAEIAVLAERLKPVASISARLQEFLIEQAERGR